MDGIRTNGEPLADEQATAGTPPDEPLTTAQAGSIAFAELVRTHYEWERDGGASKDAEKRFRDKLVAFQEKEGELMHVYWATRRPSAVALTLKQRSWLMRHLNDNDATIRLHRVTDWLARESRIAELLHLCDTLAIKVSEVLRGTTERIAMQWIYSVESHLLGLIERTQGRPGEQDVKAACERAERELIEIERYYSRAGVKAARIVYFWGMVLGAFVVACLGVGLAGVLYAFDWFDAPHTRGAQTFFICYIAGGLGAFVSVLMRMSSNSFRVDYEVGRSTITRLGSFRPFIGAIFGIALYFLIESEILRITVPRDKTTAFFFVGTLAFLAGFNERWANVLFGQAEKTIAVTLDSATRSRRAAEDDSG